MMRRPGLLLPLVAALACGHAAKNRAPEAVAPVSAQETMVACVDAMLENSPAVERVVPSKRSTSPRLRFITLRNSPSPRVTGLQFAVEPSRGTPREFVVEFAWPGPWMGGAGGMQPPRDPKTSEMEGEMLADVGASLLREVRANCAPVAPGEPVCSKVAQGHTGRCVLGA